MIKYVFLENYVGSHEIFDALAYDTRTECRDDFLKNFRKVYDESRRDLEEHKESGFQG